VSDSYYTAEGEVVPPSSHFDPDACTSCDQSGQCHECGGTGEVFGDDGEYECCEPCGGDGDCPVCEGEGTMRPYR
jgi:hypothetical protein